MNPLKEKLSVLDSMAEKFFEAEENPTLQNHIIRQMSYTADRVFVSVWDFIAAKKQEKAALEAKAESTLQKAILHPALRAEKKQGDSFTCLQCKQSFQSQKALSGHMKLHRKVS
jgi:hypothetical protein